MSKQVGKQRWLQQQIHRVEKSIQYLDKWEKSRSIVKIPSIASELVLVFCHLEQYCLNENWVNVF